MHLIGGRKKNLLHFLAKWHMSGRWTRYACGDQSTLTESRKNALNVRVYVRVWSDFALMPRTASTMIKLTTTMKSKRLEYRIYIAFRPTVFIRLFLIWLIIIKKKSAVALNDGEQCRSFYSFSSMLNWQQLLTSIEIFSLVNNILREIHRAIGKCSTNFTSIRWFAECNSKNVVHTCMWQL